MDLKTKLLLTATLVMFLLSTVFFFIDKPTFALTDKWIDEKTLGEICIKQAVPTAKTEERNSEKDVKKEEADKKEKEIDNVKENKNISSKDPLVIIYHTHSSESYLPYDESNYHRKEEKGTVREVGTVLAEELEKKGIEVIHDKTVHDRPSYNESYERSLSTVQHLIKNHPTAVYIIDLHRDAAASSAKEGEFLTVDNKRVAKFSMVVGQANENHKELYAFAKKVSDRAEKLYPGFGGAIIQQNYFYNEFISDKALLLEVGNNKNTIDEAKACGKYFAYVLGEIIMEEQ